MPLPVAELRRGRICYAIYPFAAQFPLALADGEVLHAVEDYARRRHGSPTPLKTEVRLRPVLLLHDGTRGEQGDVACLRVNTIKDRHRESPSWKRIERHEHPFFFHLSAGETRYGLRRESVVALPSVGTVHKSAILGPGHVGELNASEMQIVSQRLVRVLSLDLGHMIAERARELLRRAGFKIE